MLLWVLICQVKLRCEYTGVLSKVVLQVRQVIVLCNFLHLLLKHALDGEVYPLEECIHGFAAACRIARVVTL
jgi:hypothetical protein